MLARFALLAALLPSTRAQDLPPFDLPPDVAARVTELSQKPPFDLLAVLGDPDPEVRLAAIDHWLALDERARCALVRAGLRQGGAVAVGAAALAGQGRWLDVAETKVTVRAAIPVLNVVDTPFDIDAVFHLMDGADAAAFLTNPGPMPREIPQFLGTLHRSLGPEHYAQVEQLARGDDLLLRKEAAGYLGVLRTAHERIAAFLLAQPAIDEPPPDVEVMSTRIPYVPREVTLRAAGPGYPSLFAAFVEDLFLAGKPCRLWPALLVWQWQLELTPAAIDRALLLRLAQCDDDNGRRIAIAGLVKLGGEGVTVALQGIATREPGDTPTGELTGEPTDEPTDDPAGDVVAPWFARFELARQGDAAARAQLADPRAAPLAFALWWQLARADAEQALAPAFDADLTVGRAAFARVLQAAEVGDARGVPMAGLGAALAAGARQHPLDAERLFALLRDVPYARERELLQQAIPLLTVDNVADAPLAVLELGSPEAFAERLRAIVDGAPDNSDAMRAALPALLQLEPALLGDDAAVLRLLDHAEACSSADSREELRVQIAAARGPAVRARVLRELGKDHAAGSSSEAGAYAAAVAALGVDVRIALRLLNVLSGGNYDEAEFASVRAAMLGPLTLGDGPGAIVAWLSDGSDELHGLDGLWTLPGGRGMDLLRKARDRRETGQYREAIGQLARGGDPEARAIVEHSIRVRLYGWIDHFDTHVLTDGGNLDRVPLLLSQFESNCCTHAVLGGALHDLIECEIATGDDIAATVFDRERRIFETPLAQLRWSRIADQWLVVP